MLWDYQAGAGGRAADGAGGSHGEDPLLARNAVQVRGTAGRSRGTLGDGAGAFVSLVSHQRNRIIIPLPAKSTPQPPEASTPADASLRLRSRRAFIWTHKTPPPKVSSRPSMTARWSQVQVSEGPRGLLTRAEDGGGGHHGIGGVPLYAACQTWLKCSLSGADPSHCVFVCVCWGQM